MTLGVRSYRDERHQRSVLEAVVLVGDFGDLFQQVLHELLTQQTLLLQILQLFLRQRLLAVRRRHLSRSDTSTRLLLLVKQSMSWLLILQYCSWQSFWGDRL